MRRILFDGAQIELGLLPLEAPKNKIWIKILGIWKLATLWINVLGTWKIGKPFVKVEGNWK